jgi:hypothetical protein
MLTYMDFINNNIKRLNPFLNNNIDFANRIPKIRQTELEQLRNQIYNSIKTRNHDLEGDRTNNQQSFERMVEQTRGQDISPVSDLTREIQKKARESLF